MSVGLARVTISAPQRRVDVALPDHVPLAELLPELLRHAGEALADEGEKHGGWLLRRLDGGPLATGQGLFPQGVRDGEVLYLVPARDAWPKLEYDDVVEAIAAGARSRGGAWTPAATRMATLAGGVVALGLGLIAVLGAGPRWPAGAYLGLGVALLLTLAAVTASRAYGDAPAAAMLGGCAMPYGFSGAAVLVAPAARDRPGILGALAWLGDPEMLAGSVAVLLVAVLCGIGVAATVRVFAAGVTAGLLGALTALAGLITTASGAAAALLSVLVCGIGGLPLLAIRLGKLPVPPVTLPAGTDASGGGGSRGGPGGGPGGGSGGGPGGANGFGGTGDGGAGGFGGARDRPDRATVFAAVTRAEELLTGMLAGHAVLAIGAFAVLAAMAGTANGWSTRILIAVSAAALLLRARLFVTLRQRVPLLAAGLSGVAALGVSLLADGGLPVLAAVCVGGVGLALVTVAAGATYSRRPPSPYLGRAADLLDTLVVLSMIPVACAVLGLYAAVGDLTLS